MKCTNCGAEIPDASSFCMKCGKELAQPQARSSEGFDTSIYPMMLFGLAFMMFFFSLVPMFMELWEGAVLMDGVGILLVVVGLIAFVLGRREAKEAREETAKSLVKVKCRYCGSLNEQDAEKCQSCGATL